MATPKGKTESKGQYTPLYYKNVKFVQIVLKYQKKYYHWQLFKKKSFHLFIIHTLSPPYTSPVEVEQNRLICKNIVIPCPTKNVNGRATYSLSYNLSPF